MSVSKIRLAVLYQAIAPPVLDGSRKPMKPGGYRDSSADIAYALSLQPGIQVITPTSTETRDISNDKDWSFPDTEAGILQALSQGATYLWANTVLFSAHPLQTSRSLDKYQDSLRVISQSPRMVQAVDNKYLCNLKLRERGVRIAESFLVGEGEDGGKGEEKRILKPVRGRGSFGVKLCKTREERIQHLLWLQDSEGGGYEGAVMSEEFLAGEEITITVLPPPLSSSSSSTGDQKKNYLALPPITRFNHADHIALYNGIVAVTANSRIVTPEELASDKTYEAAMRQCELIAGIIGSTAPARIDLRREKDGAGFKAFDVNVKPNMTGPGRPGREDQDSLSALAAKGLGWDYQALLREIVERARTLGDVRQRGNPFSEESVSV